MSEHKEWPVDEDNIDKYVAGGHHYKKTPKLSKGQYRIVPNQWSDEEVKALLKMHKEQFKVKDIAKQLKCKESRVKNKLHRLGYSMKGLM